jgi:pimeloyl-ACP methyl ester carboxylesterase
VKASSNWLNASSAQFSPAVRMSGFAQLTNYTVEYSEWGDGPPLVLIPGLAGGVGLLGPLVRELSKKFRVISYELRGEDDCFALRRPFSMFDLVEDLREFIDWHCLETPTLFGVSFGGALALEFAARYPSRLQNLIVQGAGARFEPGLIQQVAKTVLTRFPLPFDNPFINQFFNLLFGGAQKQDELFDFVTTQVWRTDQSVIAHRLQLVEEYDMTERLPQIRVPSLVLVGKRDLLVSRRSLRVLSEGLPAAKFVGIPDCGHLAFVTRPEAVVRQVEEFVSASDLLAV